MRNFKLKTTLLVAIFTFSQIFANAQPGVLDFVLKTTNNNIQETISVQNQVGNIVVISIFNRKNQIVYQAKHSIGQSTKVLCELPKGVFQITVVNVMDRNRQKTSRITID